MRVFKSVFLLQALADADQLVIDDASSVLERSCLVRSKKRAGEAYGIAPERYKLTVAGSHSNRGQGAAEFRLLPGVVPIGHRDDEGGVGTCYAFTVLHRNEADLEANKGGDRGRPRSVGSASRR